MVMKMDKHLLFVILHLSLRVIVQALDQSGFIMIDCGIPENTSYTDATTGIYYVSDANYINSGVNAKVDPSYTYPPPSPYSRYQQHNNLRAFPVGDKNCYTILPPYVQDQNKTRYFIRVSFFYGNYDGKKKQPIFNIYHGVNMWAIVGTSNDDVETYEILHTPSSNFTYVCLVNTGRGTPFISTLELRLVDNDIYNATTTSGSLRLVDRYDVGPSFSYYKRYKDDIYDRLWRESYTLFGGYDVTTRDYIDQNSYNLPSTVISNAKAGTNLNESFYTIVYPDDDTTVSHIYFHFADFQSSYTREFDIYYGDSPLQLNFRPKNLSATMVYSMLPPKSTSYAYMYLKPTARSSLPPILNAYEIYSTMELPNMFTHTGDDDAIKKIKATYGVERNWQGDPCNPRDHLWEGIDCFNASSLDAPRIVSLTLSFSGLTGVISSSIFNLTMLRRLDLSFNNLTGELPNFLTQMPKLNILILSGNKFTGTIPSTLLERSRNGSLLLSLDSNPYLLYKEKSSEIKSVEKFGIAAVIAIIVGVTLIVSLVVLGFLWRKFKQKQLKVQPQQQQQSPQPQQQQHPPHPQPPQQQQQQQRQQPPQQVVPVELNGRGTTMLKSKERQFSYFEVISITGNFQSELGHGGFGKVYHGYLEERQVAVKMLSPSSAQGYKQFMAEAKLLMRVHHRNLTTLVGYCDEGDKLGLIYEFMANGDLRSHLSDRNPNILSWETRIQIALDAAQGLEYLHYGCRPPIIHRDVKSTNILLDDNFQAKLGDFGLSKVFPTESSTHVSTTFAGTPGYIDPELNVNEKSDVFSFGVVLLELITGQPAISKSQTRMKLSDWVRNVIAEGDVRNVVDPRLGADFDVNSMWKAVDLAMECVLETSSTRPTINIAVMELKTCSVMERTSRMRTSFKSNDSGEVDILNIETTRFTPHAR